jgi:hypothetical protein
VEASKTKDDIITVIIIVIVIVIFIQVLCAQIVLKPLFEDSDM